MWGKNEHQLLRRIIEHHDNQVNRIPKGEIPKKHEEPKIGIPKGEIPKPIPLNYPEKK